MKLHIENIESKFEYYNKIKKENKYLNEKIKKLKDSKKENEIIILKTENKNLKDIINEKELDIIKNENDFSKKISELNKKLLYYEDILKYQSSKISMEPVQDKSVKIILMNFIFISYFYLTIIYNKGI
jgi:hypothetical protein